MQINHGWIKAGGLLGALAVVLGAFGAHGLDGYLMDKYAGQQHEVMGQTIPSAAKYLGDFKTASLYLMFHALAIVATGVLYTIRPKRSLVFAQWCFFVGTVVFSGSLYALVLTGVRQLGAITPIGGVLFILGWLALVEGSCPGGNTCPVDADSNSASN